MAKRGRVERLAAGHDEFLDKLDEAIADEDLDAVEDALDAYLDELEDGSRKDNPNGEEPANNPDDEMAQRRPKPPKRRPRR